LKTFCEKLIKIENRKKRDKTKPKPIPTENRHLR
jgi:hypothetical protein